MKVGNVLLFIRYFIFTAPIMIKNKTVLPLTYNTKLYKCSAKPNPKKGQ